MSHPHTPSYPALQLWEALEILQKWYDHALAGHKSDISPEREGQVLGPILEAFRVNTFISTWARIQGKVVETAKSKGWWGKPSRNEVRRALVLLQSTVGSWDPKEHDDLLEQPSMANLKEAKDILLEVTGDRSEGETIALIHSELSEALEGCRAPDQHHAKHSDKIPGFLAVEEEYADAVIRIMDSAGMRGYRVAEAILAKIEFNRNRPYKHGGKKF